MKTKSVRSFLCRTITAITLSTLSFNVMAEIRDISCLASKHVITGSSDFNDIRMDASGALNFRFNDGNLFISETKINSEPYKYGSSKYTGYNTYLINSNMLVSTDHSGTPTKAAIVDSYNINIYWLYCS